MKYQPQEQDKLKQRLLLIDAVRGVAIIGVVVFHIVWDLEFVGFIIGVASHPIWLAFGRTLAGTFMFLVGVSLILAHSHSFKASSFARRLLVLLLAASTITAATWYAFPDTFIYFGILHAIAAASIIGLIFLKLPSSGILIIGVLVFLLPYFFSSPTFDSRWLAWIGFSSSAPASNDFVPIFPWVGLSLFGMAITKFVQQKSKLLQPSDDYDDSPLIKHLGWYGRHSLIIYLVHQPILLAIIIPIAHLSA